jgi:integrase
MASHFEKGRGWRYDFRLYKQRHVAPRGFKTKRDSDAAEDALRRRLMLEHAGVDVPPARASSARFANWAGVYMRWVMAQHALGNIKRPDAIRANVSSVLRFWGRRPTDEGVYVHPGAPYHDLTLADPIADPSWIRKFDDWMADEGLAGSTRNHYVTTMSRFYWLAMQAEYRDASGAPAYNPFKDRPRQKWKRRTTTLTADQIATWIQHASYHARLAIAIATLNPKFRLTNVLQLEWSDIDFEHRLIRVWDHKTDDAGKALVAAMPTQLRNILNDARQRHPNAQHVILYRGQPVKSIDEAVKNAAIAAGLPWGRYTPNGVTFHSIRHFASTQLARLGIGADQRAPVTGHEDLEMELWYTHLFPEDERAHTEALSAAVNIEGAVMAGPRRIVRPARPSGPGTGNLAPARPGISTSAVGNRAAVGTPVEPFDPNRGKLGVNRSIVGLRRGPQKVTNRGRK